VSRGGEKDAFSSKNVEPYISVNIHYTFSYLGCHDAETATRKGGHRIALKQGQQHHSRNKCPAGSTGGHTEVGVLDVMNEQQQQTILKGMRSRRSVEVLWNIRYLSVDLLTVLNYIRWFSFTRFEKCKDRGNPCSSFFKIGGESTPRMQSPLSTTVGFRLTDGSVDFVLKYSIQMTAFRIL
jgi:hypothetical protein